jgi:heat shock protein HtpX
MAFGVALLGVMPFAFVYTMSWAVTNVIEPLAETLFETTFDWRLSISLPLILGVTILGLGFQYFLGDRIALRSVGATRIDRSERPELYSRLERLS